MRSILEESRLRQCLYIVTIVIQLRWCVSICGLCAISEISFRLSSMYTLFLLVSRAIRCRWCCRLFHETIMSPNSRHGMAGWAVPSFFLSFFIFFSLHIISVPWAYRSTKNESNHAREIVSIGHVESSWFSLVQKSLGWSEMCRGNRNAGKKTQKTKLGSFLCFREISRVIFVDRTTGTIIQLLQIVIYITVQGFGIVQVENWRL